MHLLLLFIVICLKNLTQDWYQKIIWISGSFPIPSATSCCNKPSLLSLSCYPCYGRCIALLGENSKSLFGRKIQYLYLAVERPRSQKVIWLIQSYIASWLQSPVRTCVSQFLSKGLCATSMATPKPILLTKVLHPLQPGKLKKLLGNGISVNAFDL